MALGRTAVCCVTAQRPKAAIVQRRLMMLMKALHTSTDNRIAGNGIGQNRRPLRHRPKTQVRHRSAAPDAADEAETSAVPQLRCSTSPRERPIGGTVFAEPSLCSDLERLQPSLSLQGKGRVAPSRIYVSAPTGSGW